ncbi:SUKH-4 family immunity protein [Streptodolium elevatio]|uniref:SUKH-4 family immunity protein n=1 Tax=Streptodolium elevatio TaxID=3157996 RepID=A0ABV3DEK7_9ACTN
MTRGAVDEWFGNDAVMRVTGAARLPSALTHGASRGFLTDIGLPACVPHFEVTPDAEALDRVLAEQGAERIPPGAAALVRIGELGADFVAVDGATGKVWLVDKRQSYPKGYPARMRRDLLASDLSAFVHALHVVYVTSRGPREADPRGLTAYTRLLDDALDRIRDVDPAVFREDGHAPVWSALLAMWALPWGVTRRAGGAGHEGDEGRPGTGLIFDVGADLVADTGVRIDFATSAWPAAVAHEPTSRFLAEVGLPRNEDLVQFHEDLASAPLTHEERSPDVFGPNGGPVWERDLAMRDHLSLGPLGFWCTVLLDGATGRVTAVGHEDPEWPAPLVNSDISVFGYALWSASRLVRIGSTNARPSADWQVFHAYWLCCDILSQLLRAADPEACDDEDNLWQTVIDDGHSSYFDR